MSQAAAALSRVAAAAGAPALHCCLRCAAVCLHCDPCVPALKPAASCGACILRRVAAGVQPWLARLTGPIEAAAVQPRPLLLPCTWPVHTAVHDAPQDRGLGAGTGAPSGSACRGGSCVATCAGGPGRGARPASPIQRSQGETAEWPLRRTGAAREAAVRAAGHHKGEQRAGPRGRVARRPQNARRRPAPAPSSPTCRRPAPRATPRRPLCSASPPAPAPHLPNQDGAHLHTCPGPPGPPPGVAACVGRWQGGVGGGARGREACRRGAGAAGRRQREGAAAVRRLLRCRQARPRPASTV